MTIRDSDQNLGDLLRSKEKPSTGSTSKSALNLLELHSENAFHSKKSGSSDDCLYVQVMKNDSQDRAVLGIQKAAEVYSKENRLTEQDSKKLGKLCDSFAKGDWQGFSTDLNQALSNRAIINGITKVIESKSDIKVAIDFDDKMLKLSLANGNKLLSRL